MYGGNSFNQTEWFVAIVNEPSIPRWAGIYISVRKNKFSSLGILKIVNIRCWFNGQQKNILYIPSRAMFDAGENRKYFISVFSFLLILSIYNKWVVN